MLNLFTFAVVLLPVFSSVTNTFSRMLTPYMYCQSLLLTLVIFSLSSDVRKFWCFAYIYSNDGEIQLYIWNRWWYYGG